MGRVEAARNPSKRSARSRQQFAAMQKNMLQRTLGSIEPGGNGVPPMEPRLLVAYALIALLVLAMAAWLVRQRQRRRRRHCQTYW
jgi:hypothetical protein